MLSSLRHHFTYANVLATLALILAMGGTAYATATIGSEEVIDESLQSVDVKDGSLTRDDIAANTINHAKILNGSLLGVDLASNSVTSDKVAGDTLTGADILESSLGKVGDADTVDGKNASDLGVRAYGLVSWQCNPGPYPQHCSAQNSKGVSGVKRESAGIYCIDVTDAGWHDSPLVATVDYGTTANAEGDTSVMTQEGVTCQGGEFKVITTRHPHYKVSTTTGVDHWVTGMAEPANDIGFVFMVP